MQAYQKMTRESSSAISKTSGSEMKKVEKTWRSPLARLRSSRTRTTRMQRTTCVIPDGNTCTTGDGEVWRTAQPGMLLRRVAQVVAAVGAGCARPPRRLPGCRC